MKKFVLMGLAALAVSGAWAITATKEYVDRSTNAVLVASKAETAAATNATLAASKAYTDSAIEGAGGVTPESVTNISGAVTRSVVTKDYVQGLGVSGNVQSVNGLTGTVFLAASDIGAVQTNSVDYVGMFGRVRYGLGIHDFRWGSEYATHAYDSKVSDFSDKSLKLLNSNAVVPYKRYIAFDEEDDSKEDGGQLYLFERNMMTGDDTLVNTNAWVSDLKQYAYPVDSGNQLASQVQTIGAHLNAEDARFVSTNYNSVTRMPEAYVEIKLPDSSWSVIWKEMTRWNWFLDSWGSFTNSTVSSIDQKADRAWGAYDSETGAYAPDDYTWISSKKIAIAANLAYQRIVTSEGAVWVLESNGAVTETGGVTSNGFFRISDDEGHSLFEIVKGDKRTIGADASSVNTVAGFSPTKLQIGYSIVSDVHPTLYVCQSLTDPVWKAETDAECVANVTWEGSSGAYVAYVQGKAAYSSLFVKATYEVGGETYIKNQAPVSMSHIMLNGVKYAVGTASISGNTVLTLTPAP